MKAGKTTGTNVPATPNILGTIGIFSPLTALLALLSNN